MVNKNGVSAEEFSKFYPVLYHMAEENTWESIKKHGLMSTTALLDLYHIEGKRRDTIEKLHRPVCMEISNSRYGKAVIRDQKPMSDKDLEKCLVRLRPTEWYQILNRHVFFWPTRKRLSTMLNARAYRSLKHTVLTIDTALLLQKHKDESQLTAINSGCTKPIPRPRGENTFLAFDSFPFTERRKKYGKGNAVAELAVEYSVSNIRDYVIRVDHMIQEHVLETIYKK